MRGQKEEQRAPLVAVLAARADTPSAQADRFHFVFAHIYFFCEQSETVSLLFRAEHGGGINVQRAKDGRNSGERGTGQDDNRREKQHGRVGRLDLIEE